MKLVRSVLAAMSVAAMPVAAQTAATPVGPVVGVAAPWMSGDSARFGLRLGVHDAWRFGMNTTSLGVDVPLGKFTLGLMGGYESGGCGRALFVEGMCSNALSGGLALARPLAVARLGSRTTASLGIQGAAGYREDMNINSVRYDDFEPGIRSRTWAESEGTLALTLPMALSFRARGVSITPHIAPGIGYSRRMMNIYESSDGLTGRRVITDAGLLLGTGLSLDFHRFGLGVDLLHATRLGPGGDNRMGIGIRWNTR